MHIVKVIADFFPYQIMGEQDSDGRMVKMCNIALRKQFGTNNIKLLFAATPYDGAIYELAFDGKDILASLGWSEDNIDFYALPPMDNSLLQKKLLQIKLSQHNEPIIHLHNIQYLSAIPELDNQYLTTCIYHEETIDAIEELCAKKQITSQDLRNIRIFFVFTKEIQEKLINLWDIPQDNIILIDHRDTHKDITDWPWDYIAQSFMKTWCHIAPLMSEITSAPNFSEQIMNDSKELYNQKLAHDPKAAITMVMDNSVTYNRQNRRFILERSTSNKVSFLSGIQRTVVKLCEHFDQFSSNVAYLDIYNNFALCDKFGTIDYHSQYKPLWGDQLLFIDSSWSFDFTDFYHSIKSYNGSITWVIYDLLVEKHAELFEESMLMVRSKWLPTVYAYADHVVTISKAVADDYIDYAKQTNMHVKAGQKVSYFHLGSDIQDDLKKVKATNICPKYNSWMGAQSLPVFCSISTIEGRKGHEIILSAFKRLWDEDIDIALIFAGRMGWGLSKEFQELFADIQNIYQDRFIFVNAPNDDTLYHIYNHSDALIFASKNEGFGLPLVEAAQAGLSIFCSDIPVFHEVCGEHAYYFDLTADDIYTIVKKAYMDYQKDKSFKSSHEIKKLSWKQSVEWFYRIVDGKEEPYYIFNGE